MTTAISTSALTSRMYRAIRVAQPGPPNALAVVELPLISPHANEVLIRVRAIGVNPVETLSRLPYADMRAGAYAFPAGFSWPWTPGQDAAGVVEAVGSAVTAFAPGDRVFTCKTRTGAYAELVAAPADRVVKIPGALTFAQAAALPVPYYTAYRALHLKLNVRAGRSVLVHGATGGVGLATLQMARAAGLFVIGSAGSDAGAALIAPMCDAVVRHGTDAVVDAVLTATGGAGVHYIVEMLADANLQRDLRMLRSFAGAAVAVVGSRGDATITPRFTMMREASILGVTLHASSDADIAETTAAVLAGLRAGTLAPHVGRSFEGLAAAPAAHEEVIAHRGGAMGKIVIELA